MDVQVRFRDEQFTPRETAEITGVSMSLQRDWRSQGLLPARTSGRATFSPRDLSEMRVTAKLRELGLPLGPSREAARKAAPSVLFAALANYQNKTVGIEGERAADYVAMLERRTSDGYLRLLADLAPREKLYRHLLLEAGEYHFLQVLNQDATNENVEAAGLVNLWAVSRAIAQTAPRPLFTLIIPSAGWER